ncbi:MAG: glycoside hydrolase family 3 protein [Ruminococcus sp.]|nr:glycoside hydrolase family 3 protein [Ruminococcus sp.]
MKKTLAFLIGLTMLAQMTACSPETKPEDETVSDTSVSDTTTASTEADETEWEYVYQKYAAMTVEEIVAELTLEQKVAQMLQPAVYNITEEDMLTYDYGSILSQTTCLDAASCREVVDGFQQSAIDSETGIPYVYGQDDVHGVNYCLNAVYFPHNIGQGAANNEELAYQVGLITADEAKLCHWLWNFSPCVAQSVDPRWGRTYESYGSDVETIKKLSTAYTKGLIDGGLIACAKHFFADGNVVYGTGEQTEYDMLIDRGDAQLTDAEIAEQLGIYQELIDAGVQTIMISHSSLNGVKMHENKEYIMKLKDEMGFEGFIVSDWGSVGNISGATYEEQIIKSVNAGIDMLMETDRFNEAYDIIIDAVNSGEISEERINDAVTRIIRVKKNAGIFDDPLFENLKTEQKETGSLEYRKVAEQLVEESLVLIKNENSVLPLEEGAKVYITGPAADDGRVQCGGWTIDWNGAYTSEVEGVTTILEAFERYADDYGIEVITDSEEAENADVVLLCVGEESYAEWCGDTEDLELCGALGLSGNDEAIEEVKGLDKPTVTCIVAGRNVIIEPEDYAEWDSVVMCYLPGSEGKGISDVLCGCADFKGSLPAPWYGSVDEIGTEECFLEYGYGLSYGDGFTARTEPETVLDSPAGNADIDSMEGTSYTKGLYKDGVYVNECAGIKVNVPEGYMESSDAELQMCKTSTVSQCTDEKDRIREEARTYDKMFGGDTGYYSFEFINTELGIPDDSDYTEEECVNDFLSFISGIAKSQGLTPEIEDAVKVSVGGQEFYRGACAVSFGTEKQVNYIYARKIDDNLMFAMDLCTIDPDTTVEDIEKVFS